VARGGADFILRVDEEKGNAGKKYRLKENQQNTTKKKREGADLIGY